MLEQHGFYILRIRGEAADGDALHGSALITAPCLSFSLSFPEETTFYASQPSAWISESTELPA